jgi:hypothetical protein
VTFVFFVDVVIFGHPWFVVRGPWSAVPGPWSGSVVAFNLMRPV